MTGSKHLVGWAKNRVGYNTEQDELPYYTRDSLSDNRQGPTFIETAGKKDFFGIVGFIDLKGYSTFSRGKSGKEIAEFVGPFLSSVIEILTYQNALIDKTIGDEIMFVIPQIENGPPMQFDLLQILRKLKDFALENTKYKFRIGISIGMMYLDVIDTKEYREWYISGEPIIAAKRIMGISKLKNPAYCVAAICSPPKDKRFVDVLKSEIATFQPCKWTPDGGFRNYRAKGVGALIYQTFSIILT